MSDIKIFESKLVPIHEILNDEEKANFLNDLNVNLKQLPKIKITDSVVKALQASKGDVIKISRDKNESYFYYRAVV